MHMYSLSLLSYELTGISVQELAFRTSIKDSLFQILLSDAVTWSLFVMDL